MIREVEKFLLVDEDVRVRIGRLREQENEDKLREEKTKSEDDLLHGLLLSILPTIVMMTRISVKEVSCILQLIPGETETVC